MPPHRPCGRRSSMRKLFCGVVLLSVAACNSASTPVKKDPEAPPSPPAQAKVEPQSAQAAQPSGGALRLGAPIEGAKAVALGDVAKEPKKFTSAAFVTTGTVTAVCQHMGCWMELKDEASSAHIKMAGHKFFVPKTAS